MTDTDRDIIEVFETGVRNCNSCSYGITTQKRKVLDVIHRKDAEIRRLENEIKEINRIERENELQALEENKENAKMFLQSIERAKSEAIKEFAEKLKESIYVRENGFDVSDIILLTRIDNSIDNLVKEMTEGNKNGNK